MAINQREKVNFLAPPSFNACALYTRDAVLPWQDFFLSASTFYAASMAVYTLSSSNLTGLRLTATVSASPIWVTTPIPQEAAQSGSGTLFIDWTDPTTGAAVAVIGASLWAVNGTTIASGSQLMAFSGCQITAGATASQFNSTSATFSQFNAPAAGPGGLFVLALAHQANGTGETSGSNFVLFDARLRYTACALGGQGTA